MKILDINNNEIQNPDLEAGYLKDDKIIIKHHDAIPYNPGKWHYIVIAEYPNGGKDVEKFYDEPEIQPQKAWDEYENIQRYILYTPEELEQKKQQEQVEQEKEQEQVKLKSEIEALKKRILELEANAVSRGGTNV